VDKRRAFKEVQVSRAEDPALIREKKKSVYIRVGWNSLTLPISPPPKVYSTGPGEIFLRLQFLCAEKGECMSTEGHSSTTCVVDSHQKACPLAAGKASLSDPLNRPICTPPPVCYAPHPHCVASFLFVLL